jgi:hypothetical protein
MEVWFFFDEGTTGREPQMSGEETERIYTRAPPKRVGRALALLTKTYHGSRVTGHRVLISENGVKQDLSAADGKPISESDLERS